MPDNKDYTQLTKEELLVEEKKTRNEMILAAVMIGFLIGVMVFGFARNGFGILYTVIPLGLIYLTHRNSNTTKEKLAKIKAALELKRAS